MQQKRTAEEWFRVWDELAGERRKIGEQRMRVSAVADPDEFERLNRAYGVADARVCIAYIRSLMAKYDLDESDISDLGLKLMF